MFGVGAFRQRYLAEQAQNVPFFLISVNLDLIGEKDNLIEAITMIGVNPVAIVIDTLNRSLNGSESSDGDMSDYIKAADKVRETFKCAVLIIHNCGHEASSPRGHTFLTGHCPVSEPVRRNDSDAKTLIKFLMHAIPQNIKQINHNALPMSQDSPVML